MKDKAMKALSYPIILLGFLLPPAMSSGANSAQGQPDDIKDVLVIHDTIYIEGPRPEAEIRDIEEILAGLGDIEADPTVTAILKAPRVFRGYRHIHKNLPKATPDIWHYAVPYNPSGSDSETPFERENPDGEQMLTDSIALEIPEIIPDKSQPGEVSPYRNFSLGGISEWMENKSNLLQRTQDAISLSMINNPSLIEYTFWELPEPPKLPEEDKTFAGFIRSQWLPKPSQHIDGGLMETDRINWLHDLNGGIQFSQAFISPNWYQGGNNSLSLFINLYWHVQLNPIFHPNLLFDNVVSYKLGFTSSPQDLYHKYTISEDLFQWNFKTGIKAFEKWFYSFTAQFKTQILNNYGQNSLIRKASFLSPGDFNAGLGMTYSLVNKQNTLKFNAAISPLSYNLKTCIDRSIDPVQFNIPAGKRLSNEFGSSSELTLDWNLHKNVNYRSRLFMFTNYSYFQGDWENTLSFQFNRFLATQIQWHLRYDSSSDLYKGWHHWMLKEILSFGISYSFSTKVG